MKRIFVTVCMVMFLGMFLIIGGAVAFDSEHLQKLKTSNQCRNCDLSGANMSGANLTKADLRGANMSGANLSEANLSGANMSGANLTRANLSGANLSGANLTNANLTNAKLSEATWTDGSKCKWVAFGECIK
jgi:uncharacterized protein YjbI with pentapeptide repeats